MGLQVVPAYIGVSGYNTPVETDRNLIEAIFGRTGLVRPGDFAITPTGTARQVSVAAGNAILVGTENSTQGAYFVWSDGADLYTFASTATNPRIDTLVMRVVDTQYGADAGGSNAYLEIVQGIAASSPAARADSYFNTGGAAYRPGAWWRLADVRINVVDGVLPQGQITQTLQYVRMNGRAICTSSTRPSSPQAGDQIYETDTGWERTYNGTNWCIKPGTLIKYGSRNTDKSFTGTETGYLRLDGIEVVAGQEVLISTSPIRIHPASGETGLCNLRFSTSGSAGTSDTILTAVEANTNTAFTPAQSPSIHWRYQSATNVTLSVLLTITRSGGSSNVAVDSAAAKPIEIYAHAGGPSLTNTGTSI